MYCVSCTGSYQNHMKWTSTFCLQLFDLVLQMRACMQFLHASLVRGRRSLSSSSSSSHTDCHLSEPHWATVMSYTAPLWHRSSAADVTYVTLDITRSHLKLSLKPGRAPHQWLLWNPVLTAMLMQTAPLTNVTMWKSEQPSDVENVRVHQGSPIYSFI